VGENVHGGHDAHRSNHSGRKTVNLEGCGGQIFLGKEGGTKHVGF